MLAQRKARKETIEKLLLDAERQLETHYRGIHLLSKEDLADYQHKVDTFKRRIKKLSMMPADKEIEHILERERKKKEAYEEKLKRREEL